MLLTIAAQAIPPAAGRSFRRPASTPAKNHTPAAPPSVVAFQMQPASPDQCITKMRRRPDHHHSWLPVLRNIRPSGMPTRDASTSQPAAKVNLLPVLRDDFTQATEIETSTASAATSTGRRNASNGTAIAASPNPKADRINVARNTITTCNRTTFIPTVSLRISGRHWVHTASKRHLLGNEHCREFAVKSNAESTRIFTMRTPTFAALCAG